MSGLELTGCPFQPLGAYLKALGILRLVSEQVDENARGQWAGRYFVLESEVDREALIEFFLTRYSPTPVLAPWNGGSGFYSKDRKVGLDAIYRSKDERFKNYRRDLETARGIVEDTGGEKGASVAEEDERRTEILRECRNRLSDRCVEWLDAAIAISSEESRAFAPILGTGGNEGRLDYTNNFMENLSKLLISPEKKIPVKALLENALFDTQTSGLQDISIGQYDPGRSGGFNQGNGISSSAVVNPWNAVLTLEGAVAWAGGIYRKQGISYRSFLCSPFTVKPSPVGFGSAAEKDQGTARAEVWTPLWDKAARFGEIRSLLREGRAAVDGKPAGNGLEFAQAAASLGVDRAISAFVRYSLVKRRGDSYIALPAGRFQVKYRCTADRVRELMPFIQRAESAAKGSQAESPDSWQPLRHIVDEATFRALSRGTNADLIDLAAAFGNMQRWLLKRGRVISGTLAGDWIEQCTNERGKQYAESRIAAALAGLVSNGVGGLLLNVTAGDTKFFSWQGRDLASRMLSTLRRRSLSRDETGAGPFWSARRAWISDVSAFLSGELDDDRIENLMFAFLQVQGGCIPNPTFAEKCLLDPAYCVMKQLFAPGEIDTPGGKVKLKPDLAIPTLLAGGRMSDATDVAVRRLRVSGLPPLIRGGRDGGDSIRLGAALLIPVRDMKQLLLQVVEPLKLNLVGEGGEGQ